MKVLTGVVLLSPYLSRADFLVLDPNDPLGGQFIGEGYTGIEGYQFTVGAAPISVLSLGVRDWGGAGLINSHDVGIWDLQTNLLVSATVSPGPGTDGFRYSLVNPVLLQPNHSYVIAATYANMDPDLIGNGGSPTYNPAITFDAERYGNSVSGLAFPAHTDFPGLLGVFGPNAEIEVIPEPSSSILFGIGGLLLFFRRVVI